MERQIYVTNANSTVLLLIPSLKGKNKKFLVSSLKEPDSRYEGGGRNFLNGMTHFDVQVSKRVAIQPSQHNPDQK